jgi:hypothetical protein
MGQPIEQTIGAKTSLRRKAKIEFEGLDFEFSRSRKRNAVFGDVRGVFLRIEFNIQ